MGLSQALIARQAMAVDSLPIHLVSLTFRERLLEIVELG